MPPFDADALLDDARTATGLDDFGDRTFRAGLDALAEALARDAALSEVGTMALRMQLVGYLAERLRIEDWYRRHPEIEAEEITAPIVVTGLPRTGTTALSNLLAADPETRSLRFWESQRPTPPPETATYDSDARIVDADAALEGMKLAAPDLRRMHDDTGSSPTENQDLLGQHFRTQHFDGAAEIPTYVAWWLACDMAPAYRHHRRVLRLLQWRCPARRWNLKNPPDMAALDALAGVYPDARLVWTHRDPVRVLASVCRLIEIVRSLFSERVDRHAIGRGQLALWAENVRRALDFRRRVGDGAFADVWMDDLVAQPIPTVGALYDRLGMTFTAEAEARMQAWGEANPQHKHGALDYRLETYGLSADEVRAAFREYLQRFGGDRA